MPETVAIRITETGSARVAAGFRRVVRSVTSMGSAAGRAATKLARGLGRVGGLASRLTGVMAGLGVAMGGKALLAFDDIMGRLQADAGLTTKQAGKLRDEIMGASKAFNLSKDSIAAGAQKLQDYQGVLPKMLGHLGALARVAKATGAEMTDLAGITGPLLNAMGLEPKGAVIALAKLSEQARFGAVRMKDAARVLPKLLSAGAGYGFKGLAGAQQMGTLLQVAGVASGGSAEEAMTGSMALLRDLQKAAKGKGGGLLGKMGVRIRTATGDLRDPTEIMAEVLRATGGQVGGKRGLGAIFTEESIRAAMAYKGAFDQRSGKWAAGGAVATAQAAGQRGGAGTVAEQLRLLTTGIAADSERVHKALNDLDIAFQRTGKNILAWGAQNPYKAGAAAVGGYLGLKALGPLAGWLLRGMGKGAAAGGLGGAKGALGIPVFVTNMPGTFSPLGGGGGPAAAPRGVMGRAVGRAAGWLGGGSKAALAVGAGLVGAAGGAAMLVGAHSAGQKALLARQKAAEINVRNAAQRSIAERLVAQAGQLGALGRAGVTRFGPAGNQRDLTQAEAIESMRASAKRQGGTEATFQAMLPVLRQLTAALSKGPTVTVTAPGIDAPRVEAGRGGKR